MSTHSLNPVTQENLPVLDLAELSRQAPGTKVVWAIRRPSLARVLGGGENDALAERGKLGLKIRALVESGALQLVPNVSINRLRPTAEGLVAESGDVKLPPVDEVIVATGFRPDLSMHAELRLGLDPATQSPTALAPLIDPNLHSCGTVRPHGFEELAHPEQGLYIGGMKSYGRAPTFLLLTGYEQVRSVASAMVGDLAAARRVELVLPETGVCSTQFGEDEQSPTGAACCAPKPASKPAASCGTSSAPRLPIATSTSCCG